MDPIPVPAPPRSAYNPNRRVSDLILGQLKHFQHVEQRHGIEGIDPALSRDIHTEAGAARYIAAITKALCGQSSTKRRKLSAVPTTTRVKKRSSSVSGLAIAASESSVAKTKTKTKKHSPKKASKTAGKRKK